MAPTSKLATGSSDRHHRPPKESPDPDDLPSSVIWVGNLHAEITEPDLMVTFSKFSALDAAIAYSSRNYAFVFFKSPDDAKSAKESLSGSSLRGKKILIDFARPAKPTKRLWVGGIATAVTGKLLEQKFSKFGKIEDFEFHSDRNTAFLEFGKVEEAITAKKEMDGKRLLGQEIHVDFQRQGQCSRPAKRPLPPPVESIHRGRRDGPPSNTLWVGYPPSTQMDEQMLHNAMILFGEIERIKSFQSRHYCFVEFRSVDEARRAKEGLQGRLFGDPRIQILFSCSDLGPSKDSAPLLPGFRVPRLEMMFGPAGHLLPPPNGIPGSNLLTRPYMPQGLDPDFGGPNWGRPSPSSDMIPSSLGARPNLQPVWDDGFDTRESKRSRLYSSPIDDEPFHGRRVDDEPFRSPDVDYYWRGIIAKGGSHVCHARCVPIGKGPESPMPEVVNCSARTDLDVLTKHYAEAIGSDIVFFVPDSEDDFGPYTEFLRYLGSKSRAGVAKFDDGTTMFLVPPSDFLTQVLNVSGPERLYGVVLKLPQQPVALMPQRPQAAVLPLPSQYEDRRGRSISQERYDYIPQSEDSALRMDYGSTMHEHSVSRAGVGEQHVDVPHSMPSASHGYARNQETASQVEVSLTPELIATLASLIPSNNQTLAAGNIQPSSTTARSSSHPTAAPNDAAMVAQEWGQDHQATYSGVQLEMANNTHQQSQQFGQQQQVQQFGRQQQPLQQFGQHQQHRQLQHFGHQYTNQPPFGSQYQPYASLPTGTDNSTQSFLRNAQEGQEFGSNMQRSAYDSYSTHGTLRAQDTGVMFNQSMPYQSSPNLSAEGQDGRVLQPQAGLPSSGDNAEYSQMQQLQMLLNNSGEGPSQGSADKNQRYQSTLQFAASLLQKLQQQQQSSSHVVDGSGN